MKGVLKASGKHKADLVAYCGAGTSYALMGHTALHWAAAKVCITTTTDLAFLFFLHNEPSSPSPPSSNPPPSPPSSTSPPSPPSPPVPPLPPLLSLPSLPSCPSPRPLTTPELQYVKAASPMLGIGTCICCMLT